MTISYKRIGESMIISIRGEIDEYNCVNARKKIDEILQMQNIKSVLFDLGDVNFIDSTGIGLFLGRYKLANRMGICLSICNISEVTKKVFEVSGLLQIIPMQRIAEIKK